MTSPRKEKMSERHRQRQKKCESQRRKNRKQPKVKTVARQHTTYIRVQQGIKFWDFCLQGYSGNTTISSTAALLSFKNHEGLYSKSLRVVFPEQNDTSFAAGIHTLELGWRYYQARHTCVWKVLDYQKQDINLRYRITSVREWENSTCTVIVRLALHGGFWNA